MLNNPFLVACFGMLVLTCNDALIKSLTGSYATFQIVFLRFAFGALWCGAVAMTAGYGLPNLRQMRAHLARACLMIVTASGFFYALGKIPLAELFVITFTAPIFTALFGGLFLREPVSSRIMLALVAGFAGMLLITLDPARSGLSFAYEPFALFCAVVSPIAYALGLVLLRSQATGEPMSVIIGTQSALVAILMAPVAYASFTTPTPLDWPKFALAGLLGTIGYFAFTHALRKLTAARFSVVEYTGLIWAALIGYLGFQEVPRASIFLGAPLIIVGCWLVARDGKPETKNLPEANS